MKRVHMLKFAPVDRGTAGNRNCGVYLRSWQVKLRRVKALKSVNLKVDVVTD